MHGHYVDRDGKKYIVVEVVRPDRTSLFVLTSVGSAKGEIIVDRVAMPDALTLYTATRTLKLTLDTGTRRPHPFDTPERQPACLPQKITPGSLWVANVAVGNTLFIYTVSCCNTEAGRLVYILEGLHSLGGFPNKQETTLEVGSFSLGTTCRWWRIR